MKEIIISETDMADSPAWQEINKVSHLKVWMYSSVKKLLRSELSVYNKIVPVAKFADKLINNKAGLSVIMVAQKD